MEGGRFYSGGVPAALWSSRIVVDWFWRRVGLVAIYVWMGLYCSLKPGK